MKKKKNKLIRFIDYILDWNFIFGALAGIGLLMLLFLVFDLIKIIFPIFEQYSKFVFLITYLILLIYMPKIIDQKIFRNGFLSGYILFVLGFLINWIFNF